MLGGKDAMATVAVKHMNAARKFYEDTLGLERSGGEDSEAIMYKAGSSTILVYESQYAGTNEATAVTWNVGDEVAEIVRGLKARGVIFEHYDMPGVTREGDVHRAGELEVAWFKDPDGNIHAIVSA